MIGAGGMVVTASVYSGTPLALLKVRVKEMAQGSLYL